MINRAAVILKYKQPAIDWINSIEPSNDLIITLEDTNEERTVYLIDEESAENLEMMLKRNYKMFLEYEFLSWYTDESLWPKNFSLKMFKEWFKIECYSVVENLVDGDIIDEDI